MDKYLLSLLEELHTLIIPGLGALTITNEEKGEIMFMPYLSYDDGKLVGHIVQREGMDENEARNLISKYVRDIEARLNIGESYDMYQFGSFWKDGSGEIHFTSWQMLQQEKAAEEIATIQPLTESSSDIFTETSSEISPIMEEELPRNDEDNSIIPPTSFDLNKDPEEPSNSLENHPTSVTDEKQPLPKAKREAKESTSSKSTKTKEEKTKKPGKTEPAESESATSYSEEDQWNDDLDLPPIGHKIVKAKKPILEKTKSDKPKRNTGRITLFAAISVILILSGIGYFLFKPVISAVKKTNIASTTPREKIESKRNSNSASQTNYSNKTTDKEVLIEKKVGQENIEIKGEDAKPSQHSTTEKVIEKSSPPKIPIPSASVESGNYHVVGAAFKEDRNAERYVERLRSEGHDAKILGRFDKLLLVSIDSYSTKAIAKENLGSLKSISSNAWIMYYKKRL